MQFSLHDFRMRDEKVASGHQLTLQVEPLAP
jgi:hypothetical protein